MFLVKMHIGTKNRSAEWQQELEDLCSGQDYLTVKDVLYVVQVLCVPVVPRPRPRWGLHISLVENVLYDFGVIEYSALKRRDGVIPEKCPQKIGRHRPALQLWGVPRQQIPNLVTKWAVVLMECSCGAASSAL